VGVTYPAGEIIKGDMVNISDMEDPYSCIGKRWGESGEWEDVERPEPEPEPDIVEVTERIQAITEQLQALQGGIDALADERRAEKAALATAIELMDEGQRTELRRQAPEIGAIVEREAAKIADGGKKG
jgi:hypothetical protein